MAETELPKIPRGHEPENEHDLAVYLKHACPPRISADNFDPQPADVKVRRDLSDTQDLELPDGEDVRMWIIRDPDDNDNGRVFPSKTMRVPQNAVVHVEVSAGQGGHTIHWHGIEPTPANDGVGHTSFDISNFVYQFQPRSAGTFVYHCHKNTVLHFERGMYGLLIVDPPDPNNPEELITYPNGGPGYAARFNPLALRATDHVVAYDKEVFWVADDIDTRWRDLGHEEAMQDCDRDDPVHPDNFTKDGILNDFRPDIFVLTGVARRQNDPTPFTPDNSPSLVVPTMRVGETLLIRTENSSYTTTEFTLGIDAQVIAMDGYALGVPPYRSYSRPFDLRAGTPFTLTTAMRWDLLVKPVLAGDYPATITFWHSVTGRLLYTATTSIHVIE